MSKNKKKYSMFTTTYWREVELSNRGASSALEGLYDSGSLPVSQGVEIIVFAYEDKITFETTNPNFKKTFNLDYSKITSIEKTVKNNIESTPLNPISRSALSQDKYCVINYKSDNEKKFIKFLYSTGVSSLLRVRNKGYCKICDFFDFVSSKIQNGNETEITDL